MPSAAPDDDIVLEERGFRRLLRRAAAALSLALVLPLLALLALVLFLLNSKNWVDHGDRVIAQVNRVERGLLTMRAGFQGYRLSNDESFLDQYADERKRMPPALETLAGLVADNPAQAARMASLRTETKAWLAFVEGRIAELHAHPERARDPYIPRGGKPLFDAMQARLDEMAGEEQRLRAERDETLNRLVSALLITLAVAAVAGVPGIVYWLQRLLRRVNASYRATNAALADAAERFRLLSEVVSLQVWTARPDGQLDFSNKQCLQYFGLKRAGDILGGAWARYVHPDDLPAAQKAWGASLATGAHYEVEFRLRRADGEYRWFLVRAEAMRDAAGLIAKWFGTNTEIHDLKMAQSDAERASRAKDNFLAVLSHELRTPLTPVLLTAQALREDARLPAEVRAQLGMMERNIALEARLIDDLLDLTRIAKGKLPLRPQLCDAHSLISLALEIVRDEAQSKGIALEREFTARHSGLMADPSRFQQVIWNLLRNAVKFTPEGGSVAIRTRDVTGEEGEKWLSIEVRDSGIGIEQEAIQRIFEPFEQAGLGGDHRYGGVGLGLAIAQAIVDMHGGTIRAESDGAGRGAVFVVRLPGAAGLPSPMVELPDGADPFLHGMEPEDFTAMPALRLLLIEDHEATQQVLARLLERAGHRVLSANSVAGALTIAAAEKFDLVISDLGLPDGTGNDLMDQLRQKYGLRGIALTGYGMEEDLERSRQAGFFTHLIKPVDFNQLRRALQDFSASHE